MSISIRLAQNDGLTAGLPARLAHSGTCTGVAVIVLRYSNPPSCAPFAPSQLRDFIATMGALTPARLRFFGTSSMNAGSVNEQVSLIHARCLPDHSVSTHLTPRCHRFCTLPLSSTAFRRRSRLHLRTAGSSSAPGRIEFVILRTGRSPPAALHHALLRRSCIRLQAGERLPGEDFHLSDYARFQAHNAVASLPVLYGVAFLVLRLPKDTL